MRTVNFVSDFLGCGYYRMIWPATAVNTHMDINTRKNAIEICNSMIADYAFFYKDMKSVRLQRSYSTSHLTFIKGHLAPMARANGVQVIVDHDDWLFDIPEYNQARFGFTRDNLKRAAEIVKNVSYVTVSTTYLKKMMVEKIGVHDGQILVTPNRLPRYLFGFNDIEARKKKPLSKKPRILWSGSKTHIDVLNKADYKDDIEDIRGLMERLGKKVTWVFMGMSKAGSKKANLPKNINAEYVPWTDINSYPRVLANLDVDMAIISLKDNDFNRSKSNIKLLEFGACGIPTVFTDVEPYKHAPCRYSAGDVDELQAKAEHIMKDKSYRNMVIDEQKMFVDDNGFWTDDDEAIAEYLAIANGDIARLIDRKANEDIV